MRYSYQSEWPEKTDSRQTKLQKTQRNYDAVEDIPAFLKVHVRVQRNDLEDHFCCKDGYENLQAKRQFKLFKWIILIIIHLFTKLEYWLNYD